MKGVDAYDFLIGFRRKREVNPTNKKGEIMKQKRISFGQGKGSLTHNNREFMADNVDPLRTPQNITFVRQPIGEAYDQLFADPPSVTMPNKSVTTARFMAATTNTFLV